VEVKNLYNSPQIPAREVRPAGLRVAYRDTTPVEACVGAALGHGDEHFALTVDKAFQWVVPGAVPVIVEDDDPQGRKRRPPG
jgi:hypothetical protein